MHSVADLRSASTTTPSSLDFDPLQETQLLYGEFIKIKNESGDWLKVEAVEQLEYSHSHSWEGYPGWIKKDAVLFIDKIVLPNSVINKKTTYLYSAPDSNSIILPLSLGTKIKAAKEVRQGFRKIETMDKKTAWIKDLDIHSLKIKGSDTIKRELIIQSASQLLNDPYFWGGRSAHMPELETQVTATDCSGLVNLAYRVAGMDIPRDSYEQYLKAKKIKKNKLKKGDLIFSASKENKEKISHVAIFINKETLIEAPKTGGFVRIIKFKEKFGISLDEVNENKAVGNRFIYFATYF
ncbi:MAG: C40 family peptidase [Elusimicrobia bacterium]|nr:C40 family peptidase [Elusimicrobiota bacterium]